jgi:hypothetical protein
MKFHGTNGTSRKPEDTKHERSIEVIARDESRALQDASTAPNVGFGVVSWGKNDGSGDSQPEN